MSCSLCSPSKNVIFHTENWTVVLNDDQAYLGRCYFSLNRHETDVTKLNPVEVQELWQLFAKVKEALEYIWQPDHYNYVFLMNVQPHLHGHIIPRYGSTREFAGLTFKDGKIGSHYELNNVLMPTDEALTAIASKLITTLRMIAKDTQ